MTLVPSRIEETTALSFRQVRFTTRWSIIEGVKAYAVETTMASLLPTIIAPNPQYWINTPWTVWVGGPDVLTVKMGEFSRAMPGDQIILDVWVTPRNADALQSDAYDLLKQTFEANTMYVEARESGSQLFLRQAVQVEVEPDPLLRDIPDWFGDAKFGIFMHWGVFSVPGWARTFTLPIDMSYYQLISQPRGPTPSGIG